MEGKLFSKDFILLSLGRLVSLFGNSVIKFALPLYLLNKTGSSALYGTVTAIAFIPQILLSPVGGLIADRVNKRNIMLALDVFTVAAVLSFFLLFQRGNLVLLLAVTLMLLYGITGAYDPSVQASIPMLVCRGHYVAANSVLDIINSVSSLAGPVLGGILYAAYGLEVILWVCIICFLLSAVLKVSLHLPAVKQSVSCGIWKSVKGDLAGSIRYICKDKPVIGKMVLAICGINLFLSAMFIVGMPYIITEILEFEASRANQLFGFTQGALAAGGLAGGICAGVFSKKLKTEKAGNLMIACALCVFPMGAVLALTSSAMVNYLVITASGFVIMIFSTVFTVQMTSLVQTETPQNLIGKVIAVILTICMCAQPLGNTMYGFLFEVCQGFEFAVVLFSGFMSLVIAICINRFLNPTPESIGGKV